MRARADNADETTSSNLSSGLGREEMSDGREVRHTGAFLPLER